MYYPQNTLTHEASYKRCFGNCSPSPPTSHQNIYRARLGCIAAEAVPTIIFVIEAFGTKKSQLT